MTKCSIKFPPYESLERREDENLQPKGVHTIGKKEGVGLNSQGHCKHSWVERSEWASTNLTPEVGGGGGGGRECR